MGSLVSSYLYNYTTDASGNQVPPTVDASGNVIPSTDPSGNTVPVVDPSGNTAVDPSGNTAVPECNVVFEANTCRIEDASVPEPLVVPLSALVSVPVPVPTPAPTSTPTPDPANAIVGSLTSVVSDTSATPHGSPAEPNHMQKARKRPNKRR
jgi:hypothetical protein